MTCRIFLGRLCFVELFLRTFAVINYLRNSIMKNYHHIFLSICLASAFVGCNKTDDSFQTINPVYRYLSDVKSTHATMPDSLSDGISAMMSVLGVDSLDSQIIEAWSNSPAVAVFTPPVDSVFPTLTAVERQLGAIISNAAKEKLNIPDYNYSAVVWGKQIPIVFVDNVMLIALNHYLGADYPGYARWADYQRFTKSADFLPYDLAEAIVATSYEFKGEADKSTVLSNMLYNGALTEAKMRLVKDADLAHALGYTKEQLQWLDKHERDLWQELVGKKLLYDVSDFTKERLLDQTPATSLLNANAPGRAGRYLGYQIVKSYLKHNPDTTIGQLLSPDFYQSVDALINAQYEP